MKSRKKINQTYVILELDSFNDICYHQTNFEMEEFSSTEAAMTKLRGLIAEDPECFSDQRFKIAAVSNQIIEVNMSKDFELKIKEN